MNVYFVQTGRYTDYHNEWEPPEEICSVEYVAAPTRGRARYLLYLHDDLRYYYGGIHEVEWFKTIKVATNENIEEGVLPYNSKYWKEEVDRI